jgi:hypothetical protein
MEHLIGNALSEDCIACEPEQPEVPSCFEISATHPSITYFPNHPILTPDYVHPGYSGPAWVDNVPTYADNDVLFDPFSIDLFASLGDMLESGVPSWTLHFSGSGEIDVTFLQQIQGGMAWVFPDGNFLLGNLIDLNWRSLDDFDSTDLFFQLIELLGGGNNTYEHIQSFNFDTGGAHTLTAWYLPVGDLDPPWVFAGGGLRSIQLCGEITVDTEVVMPYTIVRNGCDIELRLDEAVVSIIEDVFYTDATCIITDDVKITVGDAENAPYLVATNTMPSSGGLDTALIEQIRLTDDVSAQWLVASQTVQWESVTTKKANWKLRLIANGVMQPFLVAGEGSRTLDVFVRHDSGITDGLYINHVRTGYAANDLFRILSQGRSLLRYNGLGELRLERQNPISSNTVKALELSAFYAGTPGANFGVSLDMLGQSSTTEKRPMARLTAQWTTSTDAAREADLSLRVSGYGGEVTPLRMRSTDGVSALAFHNTTPITKRIHTAVTEFTAIEEINATLHAYGLITDSTNVVPDEGGGGGGEPMPTTELVTELYFDLSVGPYGFRTLSNDTYGVWDPGFGFIAQDNGFRLTQNRNPFIEYLEVRVSFETQFESDFNVRLGFNMPQNYEFILHEELIAASETPVARVWSYPCFIRQAATSALGFWISDVFDPLTDGTILVTAIDIAVRGLATEESDFLQIEEDQVYPHRVVKYVDLTERPFGLWQWSEASGGIQPPDIDFEEQI